MVQRRILATRFLFVCLLFTVSPATSTIVSAEEAPGLVAAYAFEREVFPVADLTGHGHDGVCLPGATCPTFLPTGGRNGTGAFSFAGSGNYIELLGEAGFDFTHSLTVSLWVRVNGFQTPWEALVTKGDSSWGLSRFHDTRKATFTTFSPGPHDLASGTPIDDGGWHHVAIVYDGETKRLYVDGVLEAQTHLPTTISTNDLRVRIGFNEEFPSADFGGVADDLRIYSRALSASEIVQDKALGAAPAPPPVTPPSGPQSDPPSVPPPVPGPVPTPDTARFNGPLRQSDRNSRYFMDGRGNLVYLTGSHTWSNLQDNGGSATPSPFDYGRYLDFLEQRHHNFFRLWTWEQTRWTIETFDTNYWFAPWKYQRTGPGLALDGLPRFDLTQFNQAYFDRLRARVIEAGDRGFYVSVMLFDGWSVSKTKVGSGLNPWQGHPFNRANNVNGVDGDLDGDSSGEETHELRNAAVLALQEAYVRKVVETVNDLDNILYEISNESHGNSQDWQYHLIHAIKAYENTLPKQHPVGMTVEYPGASNADLYASPADWISPAEEPGGPPVADGRKVVIADTDHLCGICGDRKWVWRSFTRGENPIFMDGYDGAGYGVGGVGFVFDLPRWVSLRANLGYTRDFALRVNLARMTPRDDVSSTRYALVEDGAAYVIYQPESGEFTATVRSGLYAFEWFNPSTGIVASSGRINVGTGASLFRPPFDGDAVLFLEAMAGPVVNAPPAVSAGPAQTLVLPTRIATLQGVVTDEGGPGAVTTAWLQAGGPAAAVISTPTNSTTTVAVDVPGVYVFELRASDGQFTVSSTVALTLLAAVPPANGLVASFDFNTQGSVPDTSGHGHDGRCVPGATCPTFLPTGGRGGSGAWDFSGAGNFIELDGESAFDFTDALTVTLWVKAGDFGGPWAALVTKGDSAWGVSRFWDTGEVTFTTFSPSAHDLRSSTTLNDDRWHHVSIVYDKGWKRVYVDGVEKGAVPLGPAISTNNLRVRIGDNEEYPQGNFEGVIDDLRIYGRALTQGEVAADARE